MPWNEEEVVFRLAQPLGREPKLIDPTSDFTYSAQVRQSGAPVGRVTVDVTVNCAGQAPVEIPVCFDVRHYENVVTTARPIARGRKIQQEDLYLNRWDVTGMVDYCTRPDQLIGRVAIRTLPALLILKDQDLEEGSFDGTGTAVRPVVIKRQDRVQMTVKVGDLKYSMRGEALQDGRVGETIQVQNIESKNIIRGKVLGADEVEIAY